MPGSVSEPPTPNPPVETRSVVFAGDVPAGRWALVVGPNTAQPTGGAADPDLQTDVGAISDIAAAWFVGPPQATVDQLELVTIPRGISPDQPAWLYDDAELRVSHETIYRALYVQGRGALRRELTACLRTGRVVRKPRRRVDARSSTGSPTS